MLKDLRTPFFTVLFVFLGFFVFTKIFGPIPFFVNSVTTNKETLFTVDGEGEVTTIPDTALISLGVTKNSSTVESAQNEVNAIINKITADLKNLGVKDTDIKTVNYSVNPNYDYTAGRQRITGYNVNADLQVKIKPIDKANSAIDIATNDGATNVGGIQFVVDEKKQEELENQAREEAIKNAKAKAENISKSAGIKLGRIVDVRESGQGGVQPLPYALKTRDAMAGNAAEAPATELNPGENKIRINVTLSYETF
jgi:uncharacterized protein YggE